MKKKLRGFTLIELIVVIAIIGALAAILVPTMLGYVRNARVAKMNGNAKSIYSGATLAITDCYNKGLADVNPDCIYTGSDDCIGHPDGGGDDVELKDYLGEKFGGYFAFVTDYQGGGCVYALWSDKPISPSDVRHMTQKDVEDSTLTSMPMGCHPIKPNS